MRKIPHLLLMYFLSSCNLEDSKGNIELSDTTVNTIRRYFEMTEHRNNPFVLNLASCSGDTTEFIGYYVNNMNYLKQDVILTQFKIEDQQVLVTHRSGVFVSGGQKNFEGITFYPDEAVNNMEILRLILVGDSVVQMISHK